MAEAVARSVLRTPSSHQSHGRDLHSDRDLSKDRPRSEVGQVRGIESPDLRDGEHPVQPRVRRVQLSRWTVGMDDVVESLLFHATDHNTSVTPDLKIRIDIVIIVVLQEGLPGKRRRRATAPNHITFMQCPRSMIQ